MQEYWTKFKKNTPVFVISLVVFSLIFSFLFVDLLVYDLTPETRYLSDMTTEQDYQEVFHFNFESGMQEVDVTFTNKSEDTELELIKMSLEDYNTMMTNDYGYSTSTVRIDPGESFDSSIYMPKGASVLVVDYTDYGSVSAPQYNYVYYEISLRYREPRLFDFVFDLLGWS